MGPGKMMNGEVQYFNKNEKTFRDRGSGFRLTHIKAYEKNAKAGFSKT